MAMGAAEFDSEKSEPLQLRLAERTRDHGDTQKRDDVALAHHDGFRIRGVQK
jgi:hypothetical protein